MKDNLMTVAEIAKALQIHPETVRRYIKEGHLQAFSLPGGDYRVLWNDVTALLKSGREQIDE